MIQLPSWKHPPPPSNSFVPESQQELYHLRCQSIENTFQEAKARGSSTQTQYLFENLSLLQRNIQDNFNARKRDLDSQYSANHTSHTANENLPPPKKTATRTKLPTKKHEDSVADDVRSSQAGSPLRPILKMIDINSWTGNIQPSRNRGPNQITRNQARTANAKARRKAP